MNLATLRPEDIDEKIFLNQNAGVGLEELEREIRKELKDFEWQVIRSMVQCQSYREQLEHIAKRKGQLKDVSINPYKDPNYKEVLESLFPGK